MRATVGRRAVTCSWRYVMFPSAAKTAPPQKKKIAGEGGGKKIGVWVSLHPLFIHFFICWALSYIIMQANDNFFWKSNCPFTQEESNIVLWQTFVLSKVWINTICLRCPGQKEQIYCREFKRMQKEKRIMPAGNIKRDKQSRYPWSWRKMGFYQNVIFGV